MFKSRRFWLGMAVSLAFLALFLARINLREMATALGQANYVFVIPGIALYFVAVLFRTWRWKFLLRPLGSMPTARLFPVVVVGYMANNLLPVRLGEVVRSYYLGEREGVSKTAALATVIVERVFDGLALLFLLAVAALFLPLVGLVAELSRDTHLQVWQLAFVAIGPFVMALALLLWMAFSPRRFLQAVRFLLRLLPTRVADRLEPLAERFVEGLSVLRSPQRLFVVFVLSLPVWLLEAAMYYVVAFSFDLDSSFATLGILAAAMVTVTAISNLATSIPSAPGGVGPFEFFAAATLVFLGVGASAASAYAVALHVALLAPVTIAGLLWLWGENLSLSQLTRPAAFKEAPVHTGAVERTPSKRDEPL